MHSSDVDFAEILQYYNITYISREKKSFRKLVCCFCSIAVQGNGGNLTCLSSENRILHKPTLAGAGGVSCLAVSVNSPSDVVTSSQFLEQGNFIYDAWYRLAPGNETVLKAN